MTAKRPQRQEHMPVVELNAPGYPRDDHECDYCSSGAAWYHFAVPRTAGDRDAYACYEHVGLLNRHYGPNAG